LETAVLSPVVFGSIIGAIIAGLVGLTSALALLYFSSWKQRIEKKSYSLVFTKREATHSLRALKEGIVI